MLTERGVMGGQGIFAASQPLDTNVKNICKDTLFDLPFTLFSRRT